MLADIVAKRFCPSDRARLIQVETRMRNIDSNTFLRRFDCCRFLFHRTFATTFATISARTGRGWIDRASPPCPNRSDIGPRSRDTGGREAIRRSVPAASALPGASLDRSMSGALRTSPFLGATGPPLYVARDRRRPMIYCKSPRRAYGP